MTADRRTHARRVIGPDGQPVTFTAVYFRRHAEHEVEQDTIADALGFLFAGAEMSDLAPVGVRDTQGNWRARADDTATWDALTEAWEQDRLDDALTAWAGSPRLGPEDRRTADLAAWLLADDGPIAHDERTGRAAGEILGIPHWGGGGRVLAECAAKRAIIEDCRDEIAEHHPDHFPDDLTHHLARRTLLTLAQPYAGRPGWRDEWRTTP